MNWIEILVIIFLLGTFLSLFLTPIFMKIAIKTGFYDLPRCQEHKKHKEPTPLLGGLAIFAAWALSICLCVLIARTNMIHGLEENVKTNMTGILSVSKNLFFIILSAFLAVLLGLYDDRWNMRAITKLMGQIVIAIIAVTWGGVKISLFIPFPILSWLISVFWIIAIMNAVNFFDNMDGLAVGVAAISFSLFSFASFVSGQYFVSALGAVSAGASFGFWFYNHSPAQIFMGDSGSHFLGYLMAVMGVLVTYYNPNITLTKFSILVPIFILAIPIFDLFAVVVIRLSKGKPIYIGDHNHISHRFVAMGMDRKKAVLMVHLLSLTIGLSVLPILWGDMRTVIVSSIQALTILLLITLLQIEGKKERLEK